MRGRKGIGVKFFVIASTLEVDAILAFFDHDNPNPPLPAMRPCVPTTLGASVADSDTPATYGGAAQGRLAGGQRRFNEKRAKRPAPQSNPICYQTNSCLRNNPETQQPFLHTKHSIVLAEDHGPLRHGEVDELLVVGVFANHRGFGGNLL